MKGLKEEDRKNGKAGERKEEVEKRREKGLMERKRGDEKKG